MLRVLCQRQYSYVVDSIMFIADQAALELSEKRGVKLIDRDDIMKIMPESKYLQEQQEQFDRKMKEA